MGDWRKAADAYLWGAENRWGDQHVIRPIGVPTEQMPEGPHASVGRGTTLWFQGCGPRPWSPGVRAAVAVLRAYFCREFRGCGPYAGYQGENPFLIYMPDDDLRWVVGGMDFEWIEGRPRLCWTYLHPEFRGRGAMTDAVREARDVVGEFGTEKPITPAMLRVLAKIGHPDRDWKPSKDDELRMRFC